MNTNLLQHIAVYKEQVASENLVLGYQGLMQYMMHLRTHFKQQYPDEFIVGSFYQGYMDMSYFPMTPKALKSQKT
ncbi:MAG: hypothetical protein COA50_07970 [Flavobacteriaceae bacterium]|nr:MAG: hypothetical protein COA50_07970 [Flavobacteriaceae bacterium]